MLPSRPRKLCLHRCTYCSDRTSPPIKSALRVTWALDGVFSFRLYLTLKEVEVKARIGWRAVIANQVLVFEEVEMDVK